MSGHHLGEPSAMRNRCSILEVQWRARVTMLVGGMGPDYGTVNVSALNSTSLLCLLSKLLEVRAQEETNCVPRGVR